jgi:RNA polymerase sigma factor (sigma-70 family)
MEKDSHSDKQREKEILEGFLSGRDHEVRLFFEEYGGIIKKAVESVGIKDRSLTKHDLFMAAVENLLRDNMKTIRSFKGKCKLSTYIYTVCLRYAIDLAQRGIPPGPDPDTLHAPETLIDEIGENERRVFDKAMLRCNPKERVFIKMMFYDERSTQEILEFFGWKSENTVYATKNKIIHKLKKITRSKCSILA